MRAGKQLCGCELDHCHLVDVLTMELLHRENAQCFSYKTGALIDQIFAIKKSNVNMRVVD